MSRRRARVADVHAVAAGMPHVTLEEGPLGNAVCCGVQHQLIDVQVVPGCDAP